jgi:hypothetical protein
MPYLCRFYYYSPLLNVFDLNAANIFLSKLKGWEERELGPHLLSILYGLCTTPAPTPRLKPETKKTGRVQA